MIQITAPEEEVKSGIGTKGRNKVWWEEKWSNQNCDTLIMFLQSERHKWRETPWTDLVEENRLALREDLNALIQTSPWASRKPEADDRDIASVGPRGRNTVSSPIRPPTDLSAVSVSRLLGIALHENGSAGSPPKSGFHLTGVLCSFFNSGG